jgi:PAS domain S-box-containing protein
MTETSKSKAELLDQIEALKARISELEQHSTTGTSGSVPSECEENIRAIFDNLADGVLLVDTETLRLHSSNTEFCRMSGYQPDSIPHLSVSDIHPPEDLPRIMEYLEKQVDGKIQLAMDIPVKRSDGSTFYADINAFPVVLDGRRHLVGVFRDMTQRRALEMDLRNSEAAMRAVLDATTESALLVAIDGTFLALNKTAAQRLGGTVQKLLGKNGVELAKNVLPADALEACIKQFNKILQSTKATRVEIDYDGRTFDTTMYPILDEQAKVASIAVFAGDITEQKTAQGRLKASEAAMKAILDATTESVLLVDVNKKIVAINRMSARRFDGTPEDMVGMDVRTMLHRTMPHDAAEVRLARLDTVIRSGQPVTFEDRREERVFESSLFPVFDDTGNVSAVAIFARDITEQKKTIEQLRAGEATMKAILDATTESVLLVDANKRILSLNKTAAERLGMSPQDLVGANLEQLLRQAMPPEAVDERIAYGDKVMQSGKPFRMEDQREGRTLDTNMYPVFDAAGNATSMVVFARDITEQKKAQQALEKSESWYRSLIELGATVYAVLDPDGTVRYESPTLKRVYGWEPREIVGKNVFELVHPDDIEYAKERLAGLLERPGAVEEAEIRYRHKNGTWVTIAVSGVNLIKEPAIRGIVLTSHDITRRKELEEAITKSERKYRTLVEHAGDIVVIDRDGVFLFINASAAERVGATAEYATGKTMWDFFPEQIADLQVESIRTIIKSGQSRNFTGLTEIRGEKRWYNATIEPIPETDGTVSTALIVARDIHDSKQAEQELAELRQRMTKAERLASMGTIAATLSHRVTQPLTAITLSIENALAELETAEVPDSITRSLERGLDGASQIGSIIDNLRHLAKSSEESTREPVDLELLVSEVFRLLSQTAQSANVSLNVSGIDRLPTVLANRFEIEQAFFALVQNAIHAADGVRSHSVTISGSCADREVELRFSDDCGGIAPEDADRVFEPFFTTKAIGKGTGLGLCIAEQIVNRAGGRIRFENRVGKGSTFIVTLPGPDKKTL